MVSSRLQAHPARHLGRAEPNSRWKKNALGGLGEKFLAGAAPRLAPRGAPGPNSLPPAGFEAATRYTKSPPAGLLEFALGRARGTACGLHLLQQVSITIALPRVLGKWGNDSTQLGQVRCTNSRPPRFQA